MRRSTSLVMALVLVATAMSSSVVSAATSRVDLVPILEGYERPVLVTHDGRPSRVIYVVEHGGRISRATFRQGRWTKLGTFLDLTSKVLSDDSEMGLQGLAFHPRFLKNGRFYVFFNRQGEGTDAGDLVLAEYRRDEASSADVTSERVLAVIAKNSANHNGGHLAFGPDGYLYVALGDGGGGQDLHDNGQRLDTLLGAMLRIDPLDPDGSGPRTYRIPSSNPYVGRPGRDEIWANGFRNPWRYSFDRANGNLWIGDVGEGRREEVDKARSNRNGKGAARRKNYGWSDCEGRLEFKLHEGDADNKCSSHVLPIFDYRQQRDDGKCAVVGGYVHRGPKSRRWRGLYIAGDFCGELFVLDQYGHLSLTRNGGTRLSSFGEDAAGRLYATGVTDGTVYRVRLVGPRPKRQGA